MPTWVHARCAAWTRPFVCWKRSNSAAALCTSIGKACGCAEPPFARTAAAGAWRPHAQSLTTLQVSAPPPATLVRHRTCGRANCLTVRLAVVREFMIQQTSPGPRYFVTACHSPTCSAVSTMCTPRGRNRRPLLTPASVAFNYNTSDIKPLKYRDHFNLIVTGQCAVARIVGNATMVPTISSKCECGGWGAI